MTNEELVNVYQNGNRGALAELWVQNTGLVVLWSERFYEWYKGQCVRAGVEFDDLVQAGFLGLVVAADTYRPDSGFKFNTWLRYPVLNAMKDCAHFRSDKQQRDPLQNCLMLDAPVPGSDEELTRGDLTPDKTAEQQLIAAEDRIFMEQLRQVIDSTLLLLPEPERDAVQRHFLRGMTYNQIAEETGLQADTVRKKCARGLSRLRRGLSRKRLEPYAAELMDLYAWQGTGLKSFQNSCASSVERAVERLERDRKLDKT